MLSHASVPSLPPPHPATQPTHPQNTHTHTHSQVFLEEGYFERHSKHLPKRTRPLSLLPLVAIIFYEVSGGPFGIEDSVSSGGPLLAILGCVQCMCVCAHARVCALGAWVCVD